MDVLINFLTQHPHIHYAIPVSPDFNSLRPGYVINDTIPAMIVRPRSATDVAGLVSVLKANYLPFSVRVGGHDMFGRFQINHAITLDLREIAHIYVDRESQTARIGGGVLIADLLKELDQHGMVVPHPVISSVGFVGWATHGGYGLLSAEYGMGADQILQAKLVDANAAVRDADEDMLTAIRGGGGALGVIVELTIKVYPLAQVCWNTFWFPIPDQLLKVTSYLRVSSYTIPPTCQQPSSDTTMLIVTKRKKDFQRSSIRFNLL
jgi:FAD/FMN-containing dehydrogenase